jgi:NAD-dependent SIR2 family protein deacetylase
MALTMNVDDLSERARHPVGQLRHMHGSAFAVQGTTCLFEASNVGAKMLYVH